MELSKIILGCEQLGGKDHGKINFPEISKAFKVSLDFGINTFDTAAIYNLGQSEKNLEKILKSKINTVNIITKGGLNYKFSKGVDRANVYQQFDEDFLRANINSSLKRLKLKQLPLFLIHYPPKTNRDMVEICKSLEKFKKQKKILNYGFSNIDYMNLPIYLIGRCAHDPRQVFTRSPHAGAGHSLGDTGHEPHSVCRVHPRRQSQKRAGALFLQKPLELRGAGG